MTGRPNLYKSFGPLYDMFSKFILTFISAIIDLRNVLPVIASLATHTVPAALYTHRYTP